MLAFRNPSTLARCSERSHQGQGVHLLASYLSCRDQRPPDLAAYPERVWAKAVYSGASHSRRNWYPGKQTFSDKMPIDHRLYGSTTSYKVNILRSASVDKSASNLATTIFEETCWLDAMAPNLASGRLSLVQTRKSRNNSHWYAVGRAELYQKMFAVDL